MTSPKGNGIGMKQIWKVVMMMVTFAVVIGGIIGSYYQSKADTTSQITEVKETVTAVKTKQAYTDEKIEKLAEAFRTEEQRSVSADSVFLLKISSMEHAIEHDMAEQLKEILREVKK